MKAFQSILTNVELYGLGYGFYENSMVFDMLSKTSYKSVITKKPDLDFFEKMFFNNATFVETKS